MQKKNPTTEHVVEVVNQGKNSFESCFGGSIKPGEVGYQLSSVVNRFPSLKKVSNMPVETTEIAPSSTPALEDSQSTLEATVVVETTPSTNDTVEPVETTVEEPTTTKSQVHNLMSESKPTPTKKPRRKGGRPKGSKNKPRLVSTSTSDNK